MYPRSVQIEAFGEFLGDHHDRLSASKNPIASENDLLVGRHVEVHPEWASRFLAPHEDLPERLEAVLDDQVADGDLAPNELVPHPLFEAIWHDHRFGVEEVRSAGPALQ